MKKILHLSTFYPPHCGGIEDVCFNIVRHLSAQPDVEQQVFCFNDAHSTVRDQYDGVPITRVGRIAKIASQSISLRYFDRLRSQIRRFMPDYIHFHAPNPLAAACLLLAIPKRTKLIVHWHSDIIAQRRIYRLIKPVESALMRRANVIVATSQLYIEGSAPLKPHRLKCVVIPNIVNTSKLRRNDALVEEVRQKYSDKPLLLFVGRHVPYKGLEYLLAAVSTLKHDCEVVIGGRGPLTEELQRRFPLTNVHFVGRLDDELLSAYYHAADLFMFPSITKNEAFGVALAEAMYCQTPAVTFKIEGSGVNWVNLDKSTGLEVANGDVPLLAKAVDQLLSRPDLRQEYGNNAHQRVVDYMTIDKVSHLLDALYL